MQHTSLRVVVSSIFPDDKAEDHEHSVVVFAVAVGKRRQTEFHHHELLWLSVSDRRLTNGIPLLSSSLFFPRRPRTWRQRRDETWLLCCVGFCRGCVSFTASDWSRQITWPVCWPVIGPSLTMHGDASFVTLYDGWDVRGKLDESQTQKPSDPWSYTETRRIIEILCLTLIWMILNTSLYNSDQAGARTVTDHVGVTGSWQCDAKPGVSVST